MNDEPIFILPYTRVVGQDQLKLALELTYITPRIGGVLISGERGTGKSTIVRAFVRMLYGDEQLPITIPINATEDRVIGGWQISELVHGEAKPQPGLLEEANGKLLYIDEVNLLDDHIVNIILDATSTGVLVIQHEGRRDEQAVQFTLVGTMNPEEGSLRPQLLDRFGLMVSVAAETDFKQRYSILKAVLDFDEAVFQQKQGSPTTYFSDTNKESEAHRTQLEQAKQIVYTIEVSDKIATCCVTLAQEFHAEGHRSDYLLILAARACAARLGDTQVMRQHVESVAPLVLQHRRANAKQLNRVLWSEDDKDLLTKVLEKYE